MGALATKFTWGEKYAQFQIKAEKKLYVFSSFSVFKNPVHPPPPPTSFILHFFSIESDRTNEACLSAALSEADVTAFVWRSWCNSPVSLKMHRSHDGGGHNRGFIWQRGDPVPN